MYGIVFDNALVRVNGKRIYDMLQTDIRKQDKLAIGFEDKFIKEDVEAIEDNNFIYTTKPESKYIYVIVSVSI